MDVRRTNTNRWHVIEDVCDAADEVFPIPEPQPKVRLPEAKMANAPRPAISRVFPAFFDHHPVADVAFS